MGNLIQKPQRKPNQKQDEEHMNDALITCEEGTFTCEICYETAIITNKKFNNINKCIHPYCTNCIIKYIQVKLEDNVSNIKCPATTCIHSLKPLSCRLIIPNQMFTKWCDLLCESSVLGVERVYCPNLDCLELILNECDEHSLKRCVCPSCGKAFCYRCKVSWHDVGDTCGEIRHENDVVFDVVCKKNKWKNCPKCRRCVERVDGCNTIYCRCGTKFCYECGKEGDTCDHSCYFLFSIFTFFAFTILFCLMVYVYFVYFYILITRGDS